MISIGLGLTAPRGASATSALPALKGYTSTLAVYDPSDLTTMWQDRAGTTTQAVGGQPLGYMKNVKTSATALHMVAPTDARRPILAVRPVSGVRNLLTYSEEFDNAAWTKSSLSVTANATTAPDGAATADKLVEDTSTGIHQTYQLYTSSTPGPIVISFYAKAAGRDRIQVFGNWSITGEFNLSTGAVSGAGRSITPIGNGWYRCAFAGTTPDTAARSYGIRLLNAAGSDTYTGDGTSGIYVWGAQLETGGTVTAYQKVVSAYEVSESGIAPAYNPTFDGTDDALSDAATAGLPANVTLVALVKTTDPDSIILARNDLSSFIGAWDGTASAVHTGAGTPTVKVDGTGYTTRSALKAAISDGVTHTVLIEAANISTWNSLGFSNYAAGSFFVAGTVVPVWIGNAGGADYATALAAAQAWALELKTRLAL